MHHINKCSNKIQKMVNNDMTFGYHPMGAPICLRKHEVGKPSWNERCRRSSELKERSSILALWKCSGIKGSMYKVIKTFICSGCVIPVTGTGCTSADIGVNANLELVDKFCYLGDMLNVDEDADAAVENRKRIGWNKLRQLVPLLTNKDISLKVRERLYSGCVRYSMLHGTETWPVRKENEVALQSAEMRMVRWMCGMKL